jgi:hypothetical protein
MATTEVIIEIRVDSQPHPSRGGISGDAETVIDECYYVSTPTRADALDAAAEALKDAAHTCEVQR